jgi:hypothetical protein
MKKALLVTGALAFALSFAPAAAEDSGKVVTIGTHASGNVIPWWGASYNSCRFQCLWLKSTINYAGYINVVEFEKSSTASGTYNDVRVWLCHSTKTQLEATFDNNYTGKTPVQVRTGGNLTFSGSGYFDIGITPDKFNYNNSDNLLMEIRWNGDSGTNIACYRSNDTTGRVYAWDHNARSGSLQITGQCIRLHIGTMTGVQPASLGRVKSLFR